MLKRLSISVVTPVLVLVLTACITLAIIGAIANARQVPTSVVPAQLPANADVCATPSVIQAQQRFRADHPPALTGQDYVTSNTGDRNDSNLHEVYVLHFAATGSRGVEPVVVDYVSHDIIAMSDCDYQVEPPSTGDWIRVYYGSDGSRLPDGELCDSHTPPVLATNPLNGTRTVNIVCDA